MLCDVADRRTRGVITVITVRTKKQQYKIYILIFKLTWLFFCSQPGNSTACCENAPGCLPLSINK